ncbi:ABC transporter substrate-binding protein [Clostridium septicum]|uniref:ABC transporter substrate-binding protein n=1 Tax=Clostridium septicum TaxID=1504 RepID=A0A9N7JMT4_CLOSE|nr:ABC transporter substrate-binding protein [Clostridium septicum]AYE34839.1 ABC transporter substrate-binding protein [Clostridium septicum]MDU1313345.1 ABC transporter substrate-binding protein [Clostridium septicum]QAS60233.1 ABC transporter substrate-binding protein [Clostridium septicum]UEC20512.1 ABC transporter substrate-binding protein [Clostridium septicum]USS01433.1 ABC transporter substrate-binding protein [Clostridium septicum]
MIKKVVSCVLVAAMALSLVACGGNKGSGSSSSGESKIMYSNGGPVEFFETPWLNPGVSTYSKVLYDHLIVADADLKPSKGQLAKEYKLSDDGKELVFDLRDDIYWHDGEKITPQDIKWSIEYSMKTAVTNPVFLSTFKAIKGTEDYLAGNTKEVSGIVIDGNKITLTFDKVAPDALLTFTQFAPLPEKYFEGVDPLKFQQAEYFQKPIGSGPFKIKEVKMNDYTTLEPFEKYYNGVADYTIHLTPSPGDSDANLVNNAKSGLLDYGYTKNVADVKALKETDSVKLSKVDVRYTRLFYVNKFNKPNGSKSPLADPKVRQAIRYAIDMKTIGENLFDGTIIPANSLTPNGADKVDGLNNYDFNPEKAKELLKEANWDENYTLEVVYYYTDQLTVDLMTSIQSYLKEVGIKMNFKLVEGDLATILWKAPEDQTNGPSAVDWDLAYAANAALSMHEYYDRYRTGSPSNSHTPADETLNKLIDATNVVDTEAQKKAYFELQKYENENLFSIPLYYQPIFLIESNKIETGIEKQGNPQFNYDWNIQNWKIK